MQLKEETNKKKSETEQLICIELSARSIKN